MTSAEAIRIVNAYVTVLASLNNHQSARDSRLLPQPKARIKQALLFVLRGNSDETVRAQLRSGYVLLSTFQDMTSEQIAAVQTWSRITSQRASNKTLDAIREEAKVIASVGDSVTKLQDAIAVESDELLAELKAAGF